MIEAYDKFVREADSQGLTLPYSENTPGNIIHLRQGQFKTRGAPNIVGEIVGLARRYSPSANSGLCGDLLDLETSIEQLRHQSEKPVHWHVHKADGTLTRSLRNYLAEHQISILSS